MADLSSLIEKAFKHDERLRGGLQQIAALDRDTFSKDEVTKLLSAVSNYILSHSFVPNGSTNANDSSSSLPASKKRKLESDDPLASASRWRISHSLDGTSFALPVRKKLDLCISDNNKEGLWVPTSDGSIPEIGVSWSNIEHILALPVPEKAQAITQFVVIPRGGDGLSESGSGVEPISWTITHARSKDPDALDPTVSTLKNEFAARGKSVAEPSTEEFSSSMQQGLRKGEKPYHVKAFRGSKEGYLYFLSSGIFYGFKKPLLFFEFAKVASISYTNVLQRTFNLNITAFAGASGDDESEFEFSMLDQADFEALDAYVKRHGLSDASMAEQRRAKKLNVNPVVEVEEGEEGTELDKAGREAARLEAQRLAEETSDDEEEDENFDPGSDGDSEGEGSDSSDEEEEERSKPLKKGRDLVQDELGSEAEEVEVSDDED